MTKQSIRRIPAQAAALASHPLQIICRCDSMAAVRAAADNGADGICLAWRHSDQTAGLSLPSAGLVRAIRYARDRHCEVLLDLPACPEPRHWLETRRLLERAVCAGVDGILASDPSLLLYWKTHYPRLRIHHLLTEQTANIETIRFLCREFGVQQMVLPHLLSMRHLESLLHDSPAPLAVSARGHFFTSSIATPAAAPLSAQLWCAATDVPRTVALGACSTGEAAANDAWLAPPSDPEADTLHLLARLGTLGVNAIWVDASAQTPARLAEVTKVWRAATDRYLENPAAYAVSPAWSATLRGLLKGPLRN